MSEICVIGIYVPELQRAVAFYQDVLGFEVNKAYGTTIVSLKNGDLPLILEESEEAKVNRVRGVSGVVLALQTSDIQETLHKLKRMEVELLTDEPMNCPPGQFIRFRDPFGNILEYLQFM